MLSVEKRVIIALFIFEVVLFGVTAFNPYFLRKEKAKSQNVLITKDEFSFIVGIYANLVDRAIIIPKCLGIVLNPITILTSATCVHDDVGNQKPGPRIFLVRYNIREGCDTFQEYEPRVVRTIIIHESFDFNTRKADLAFLTTYEILTESNSTDIMPENRRVPFGAFARSEKYTVSYEEYSKGTSCMFFGFLSMETDSAKIQRLARSNIEIEDINLCINSYAFNVTQIYPDKYCAGVPSKGSAPTLNDTGGPLICGAHIVGIASSSSPNATNPGVFTKLSEYKKFVKDAYVYAYKMKLISTNKTLSGAKFKPKWNLIAVLIISSNIFV